MHFAVCAQQCAIGIDDGGGVVENSRRALLEKRGDEHHFFLARKRLEGLRGGAWIGVDWLCEPEITVVFALAKVLRAEEFLRANDLCSSASGSAGGVQRGSQIGLRIDTASVLKQAEGDCFYGIFHCLQVVAMVLKRAVKSSLC